MKKLIYTCTLTAALLVAPFETTFAVEAETAEAAEEETAEAGSTEETASAETTEVDPAAEAAEETTDVAATEAGVTSVSDSRTLDACYSLALNAINAEDYDTAKDYLSVCFGYCDPDENPELYADLLLKQACINMIEEKNDLALRNLDAAIRMCPDLADAYLVRAEAYVAQNNVDKAVEDLEKYIELTEDTSIYETVAQLQEANGDAEAAQQAYDKFVEGAGGEVEEAGFQSGLYRMQNGNYEDAIEAFEAYKDNETYGAGAMYNIGVCKMDMNDFAGAAEAFDACEEKGGEFEGLYYNRGICRLMIEDWANSAVDFEVSIEKEPYVDSATYNLAICQMQQEDYETAVATFTSCIGDGGTEDDSETEDAGTTDNYGAYYYRAVCEGAIGSLDDALADYTVCIDNGYELTQSYYQRAQIYAALGDTENQNKDLAESLKYTE